MRMLEKQKTLRPKGSEICSVLNSIAPLVPSS
jgi:hypothetical protein